MENGMCYIFFGESFKDFNQGYGFHLFTFGGIFMKCLKKLLLSIISNVGFGIILKG